jgi:hypothetical protein
MPHRKTVQQYAGQHARRLLAAVSALAVISVLALVATPAAAATSSSHQPRPHQRPGLSQRSGTASRRVPGSVSSTVAAAARKAAATPADAPDGLSPFATVTGKVYMSEDGIGTNDPAGGPIYVQKNDSSATVQAAYLLAAGIPGYTMQNGDVTLDGTSLSFDPADSVVGNFGVNSVWTNVTSIVKPVVDAAAPGNIEFTAAEPLNTDEIDGEILAVIMNDPTLPTNNTVSFLFGALDTTGDNFSIGLASPLNLGDPNLALTMSIGDSYGYQGPPATGQYSTISVNGTLMTSSAGGNDDSICKYDTPQDFTNCGNGTLITVGGIGDSTANPPDPTATDSTCGPPGPPRCDDELYNLLPFVHNGDTSIQVNTDNPSNNDNIFFTGFQLDSAAAVVGEGAVLTPVSGSNPVNSPYTFTTKVQDANGNPIVGQPVTFTVLSGPNAGETGNATTDANGNATFTYTSATAGTDTVQVSFTDPSGNTLHSNTATVDWTSGPAPTAVTTSLSGGSQSGAAITVPPSTPVTDSATLSGNNAATAGGTVTYNVYSDPNCTVSAGTGGTVNVTNGTVPSSNPVTLPAAGTYYWVASYSGDSTNAPSASSCGAEKETVAVAGKAPKVGSSCHEHGTTSVIDTVTTTQRNELVVAYVTAAGPAAGGQTVTVAGSGLTWTQVAGENSSPGDAEVWVAKAGAPTTVNVTATASKPGYHITQTAIAYKNATGIGASGTFTSASGAPTGTITTTQGNSWVWGVGFDGAKAIKRTVGSGQKLFSQNLGTKNASWVQSTLAPTPAAGTSVTINDTAPTADPYNLVLVEIH